MAADPTATVAKRVTCPLIKFIGAPKKNTSHTLRGRKAQIEYDDYVEVVESLYIDPALRAETASFVRKLKKSISVEKELAVGGDDIFDHVLERVSQMDELWSASYHAKKLGVDMSIISKAVVLDASTIKQLNQFFLNTNLSAIVPPLCLSRPIMERSFDARCVEAGSRHDKVKANGGFFAADGGIDWSKGVYKPEYNAEGFLATIEHTPTGYMVHVEQSVIDNTWDVDHNWSDQSAEFVKGDVRHGVYKLFKEKKKGPKLVATWSGKADDWAKSAAMIAGAMKASTSSTQGGIADDEAKAFTTPLKEKRKAATEKGLLAIASRKAIVAKRRRVQGQAVAAVVAA
jgi:hypothetical protein